MSAQQTKDSQALMNVTHTAWQIFGEYSADTIVKGFKMHVQAVTPALLAVTRKLSQDGFDAIVEGVHCYSDVLDQLAQIKGLRVCPQLLVVTNELNLLNAIQQKEAERSHTGEPKAWKEHIKTIMTIQDFLIHDAKQRNIHIQCTK